MISHLLISVLWFACIAVLSQSHQAGAAIIAGNFIVVQKDSGHVSTSVSELFGFTAGEISYVGGWRGDFGFRFDQATPVADVANGIMLLSISENGRSNQGGSIGAGLGYAASAIQGGRNLGTLNPPNRAAYGSAIRSHLNQNHGGPSAPLYSRRLAELRIPASLGPRCAINGFPCLAPNAARRKIGNSSNNPSKP